MTKLGPTLKVNEPQTAKTKKNKMNNKGQKTGKIVPKKAS